MSSEQISHFLNAAIRNRIAVRLIAEQHIVLSRALQNPERADAADVGVVDKALSPVEMIRMCASFVTELCEATLGAAPPIVIDGATDATFACVISLSFSFFLFFSKSHPRCPSHAHAHALHPRTQTNHFVRSVKKTVMFRSTWSTS